MNDLTIFWQYLKFIFEGFTDAMKQLFSFLLDETDSNNEGDW